MCVYRNDKLFFQISTTKHWEYTSLGVFITDTGHIIYLMGTGHTALPSKSHEYHYLAYFGLGYPCG